MTCSLSSSTTTKTTATNTTKTAETRNISQILDRKIDETIAGLS
jgi:hypothetical protein